MHVRERERERETFFDRFVFVGDVLEYATLLSVKAEDVESFDRNLAQVKAYYSDYW